MKEQICPLVPLRKRRVAERIMSSAKSPTKRIARLQSVLDHAEETRSEERKAKNAKAQ
jgi:hypothetical protein